jgi:hypothetical protein
VIDPDRWIAGHTNPGGLGHKFSQQFAAGTQFMIHGYFAGIVLGLPAKYFPDPIADDEYIKSLLFVPVHAVVTHADDVFDLVPIVIERYGIVLNRDLASWLDVLLNPPAGSLSVVGLAKGTIEGYAGDKG